MILKQDLKIPPWLVDLVLQMEDRDPYKKQIILAGGVRNLGKTTNFIQYIRHLGSKQTPDRNGNRKLKFFMLRTAYREMDQLVESISEWFDEVNSFEQVKKGKTYGFSYKDLQKSPKIVWHEPTPDLLGLILGKEYQWDMTTTTVEITCYSYNKPTSDAAMRGTNLGSGMLNEAQTLKLQAFQTAKGSFGRPEGKILYPTLLLDHNMPGCDDPGYKWLKSLYSHDKTLLDEEDIFLVDLPAPYTFEQSEDGDFILQGRKGRLVETKDFLLNAPHLRSLDAYKGYKLEGDDSVLRNLLGKFGVPNHGSLLYHEFNADKHCKDRVFPPNPSDYPDHNIICAIDFGLCPAVLFSYVDQGQLFSFKEISIEDINFFELLEYYLIPYMKEKLPYYYNNNQIVIVGDPTSGSRRSQIKSQTPFRILTGETDINGDEDGNAERYSFEKVYPSPCGNSWEHRINITKHRLTRPFGFQFDSTTMPVMRRMFEEYVESSTGGKPIKKSGDLLHGIADAFQYTEAYIQANGETYVDRSSRRKLKIKRANRIKYV